MKKKPLSIKALLMEAAQFAQQESICDEKSLYGVTDGKAVGTYLEHKFKRFLSERYHYEAGNSASGKDFPDLAIDMKVTSIRQPQSSSPFESARQKVFGLGYGLLVFVYEKIDDAKARSARLIICHTVFVEAKRTADFQTTTGILDILGRSGNTDDIAAFLQERHLPVDDIQMRTLSEEIIENPPEQGYLTISNALQWRLQYARIIQEAGKINGIFRVT